MVLASFRGMLPAYFLSSGVREETGRGVRIEIYSDKVHPWKGLPTKWKGRVACNDPQLACLEIRSTVRAKIESEQLFQGSPGGFTEEVMALVP